MKSLSSVVINKLRRRRYILFFLAIIGAFLWAITSLKISRLLNKSGHFFTTYKPLKDSSKFVKSPNSDINHLLSKPIINKHDFHYIHNPTYKCHEHPIEVIFTIRSDAINSWKRQKFRSVLFYKHLRATSLKVSLLFFIGLPGNGTKSYILQRNIDNEARHYNDIVQENYGDVFRNRFFKSVSILKWIRTFCSNAKYVIRVDDDTNVVVNQVINVIYETGRKFDNFILSWPPIDGVVNKDSNDDYYVSEEEYFSDNFTSYMHNGIVGYNSLAISLLYEAALRLSPVWMQDLFINGVCGMAANVIHVSDERFKSVYEDDCSCD